MRIIRIFGWTLLALLGLDLIVKHGIGYHEIDRRKQNRIQRQAFEGRPIESKLKHYVRYAKTVRPSISSGWADTIYRRGTFLRPEIDGQPSVTFYGMSFSNHVGKQFDALEEGFNVRLIAGPSAPLSHSFYSFINEPELEAANVPVLAVLLEGLPGLYAVVDAGYKFKSPHAYLFPRYSVDDGELRVIEPPVRDFASFASGVEGSTAQWDLYRSHLLNHDSFVDPFVLDASFLDNSFCVRLLRQAWVRHKYETVLEHWKNDVDWEMMTIANRLLTEFHQRALDRGQRPIVLIVNARGHNAAEAVLAEHLKREGIPFLLTSSICPPPTTLRLSSPMVTSRRSAIG